MLMLYTCVLPRRLQKAAQFQLGHIVKEGNTLGGGGAGEASTERTHTRKLTATVAAERGAEGKWNGVGGGQMAGDW